MSSTDIDIKDILGDLDTADHDRYLQNQVKKFNPSQTLETPDSVAGTEDPTSEFLNLKELTSLDEFPAVQAVPDVYQKQTAPRVTHTRTFKPRAKKKWTQRKAYAAFMACLQWMRADPEHLFQQTYWAEQGIVEGQIEKMRVKYPILQYVLEQIRATQEAKLLVGAATEKLHPGFVKFFLNCRYQDKYIPHTETKQEITGNVTDQKVHIVFEEVADVTNKSQS